MRGRVNFSRAQCGDNVGGARAPTACSTGESEMWGRGSTNRPDTGWAVPSASLAVELTCVCLAVPDLPADELLSMDLCSHRLPQAANRLIRCFGCHLPILQRSLHHGGKLADDKPEIYGGAGSSTAGCGGAEEPEPLSARAAALGSGVAGGAQGPCGGAEELELVDGLCGAYGGPRCQGVLLRYG
jgi:hypothetical protein